MNILNLGEIFGNLEFYLDDSITFHTLRHSFACEYIKSRGDIWELRILLGHSSINSTMVYLHMAKDFNDVYSPLDGV